MVLMHINLGKGVLKAPEMIGVNKL
jgi:hypothetical protein